jgi:phosphomevalonate decarboxylase
VYVNTKADHAERVESAIQDCGVETMVWQVGGPASVLGADEALF